VLEVPTIIGERCYSSPIQALCTWHLEFLKLYCSREQLLERSLVGDSTVGTLQFEAKRASTGNWYLVLEYSYHIVHFVYRTAALQKKSTLSTVLWYSLYRSTLYFLCHYTCRLLGMPLHFRRSTTTGRKCSTSTTTGSRVGVFVAAYREQYVRVRQRHIGNCVLGVVGVLRTCGYIYLL
jgi:hypothetical protein